jgi:phage shock protein C
MMRGRFAVDREHGKIFGVCAGIANHTGVDVTLVRAGFIIVTLMGGWPWTLVAYGIAAFAGRRPARSGGSYNRLATREESQDRLRSLDLRMQAVETYVTSSNSSLAREIEELR